MTCPIGSRDSQRNSFGAHANNTRRDSRKIERSDVVNSTGISFTSSATIADSNSRMAVIGVGDTVQVRGSPLNSRTFNPSAASTSSLTVRPAQVQTEAAGSNIALVRVG